MSDEEVDSIPENWVSVHGDALFESADDALECLVQLKELKFGDVFTDRETELDSEENDRISIQFSNSDNFNSLRVYTDSENELTVRLSLEGEYPKQGSQIMSKILDHIPPITISNITVMKEYDTPFAALELPIVNSNYDVIGIRINHEGVDYILQEHNESTRVTASNEVESELESSVDDDFLMKDIGRTDQFLEGFK